MLKTKRVLSSVLMTLSLTVPMTVIMSNKSVSADIIVNNLYTDNCASRLSISNGTATCMSVVDGFRGKTTKIVIAQTLQKKSSTGSWSNSKTSSKTVNSYTASLSNSYSGLAKGTYRVKTSAVVYSGNKNEAVTSYSAEKTVK